MGKTKPPSRFVTKDLRDERMVCLARRPEILSFVHSVSECHWGVLVHCSGLGADLVRCGLVEAWMLEGLVKPRQRSHWDGYGNRYVIVAKAQGCFEVSIHTFEAEDLDLHAERTRKLVWFKEHGAALDATVAAILKSLTSEPPTSAQGVRP